MCADCIEITSCNEVVNWFWKIIDTYFIASQDARHMLTKKNMCELSGILNFSVVFNFCMSIKGSLGKCWIINTC